MNSRFQNFVTFDATFLNVKSRVGEFPGVEFLESIHVLYVQNCSSFDIAQGHPTTVSS